MPADEVAAVCKRELSRLSQVRVPPQAALAGVLVALDCGVTRHKLLLPRGIPEEEKKDKGFGTKALVFEWGT